MEQMKLKEGRRMADEWLAGQQEQLKGETDENRRRLLTTLYSRQQDSMDYLALIRLDMGKPRAAAAPAPTRPGRLETILTHPLCGMALSAVLLACVMGLALSQGEWDEQETKWQIQAAQWLIPAALACAMMLARGLVMLLKPRREVRPVVPEVHEPYLNRVELERFLRLQSDRIAADAESIAAQYAITDVKVARGMENDFGNIYCALYEARVDAPENEDIAYPLSIAQRNLLKLGYEPVEYNAETASMFDVLPTDGPDEMRCPALRSRENGVVLKKGLYLRGQ